MFLIRLKTNLSFHLCLLFTVLFLFLIFIVPAVNPDAYNLLEVFFPGFSYGFGGVEYCNNGTFS